MSIRLNANAVIVRNNKILLIEFNDENGIHYNLPGGGVDEGESIAQGLQRECREEANAEISLGRLLLIYEYVPGLHGHKYGPRQKVGHIFECELKNEPSMPAKPDTNQIGVKWIPLDSLASAPLFPAIAEDLLEALKNRGSAMPIVSGA